MTAEEGASCESMYGYGCEASVGDSIDKLLEISDTDQYTGKPDTWTVEAFLESLDRPELSDRQDQKKAKNNGSEKQGEYVFTHYDDPRKHIERYRYYHTVGDTGQCNTDPRALGIELAAAYTDDRQNSCSKSIPSVTSALSCSQEVRNILQSSRLSISEMSTNSIKRNKSAPCSQPLKSNKRIYLTWEQYVAMCESDAPSPQNQLLPQTGSSLVSDEAEQTTVPDGGMRKVSSALLLRRPCIDLNSIISRKDDVISSAVSQISTGSEHNASKTTGTKMGCARSDLCLSDSQRRLSRSSVDRSSTSIRTLGTLRKSKQPSRDTCTEGGSLHLKDKSSKQQTLPTHVHLEQGLSNLSGEKITLKEQPTRYSTAQRCRNVRVNTVYRFTKGRRKQIHL